MRALVIYESMFGNTEHVAKAIAEGIGFHVIAETIDVSRAPGEIPSDMVLVVIGAPTHAHGMTTSSSRADAARRAGERLVTRGDGIREWIERVQTTTQPLVATFDTRIKGPGILWGSAAKAAAKELTKAGFRVAESRSFLIDGPTGPVFDRVAAGELDKAKAWGRELAASVARVPVPA